MRLLFCVMAAVAAPAAITPLAEPAVSPDRKEIAFVSAGDIWAVPAQGGEARLLVSHAANDTRPLYSPDGRRLAFLSTRGGAPNLYTFDFATGAITRLTYSDSPEILDNWSRDGKYLYFSSASGDIGSTLDIWRVPAGGGTPEKVSADRYASEYHAAPTPDGKRLLFVARGVGPLQWWRKGRSHLDESEIWILDETAAEKDRQILPRGAKQLWPQWMPDGESFYYVSDRGGGRQNIYRFTFGKGERQITSFTDGRVLYPNLSYDGKLLVFERDFAIWRLDTASGRAEPVSITLRGAPAGPDPAERLTLTSGFRDLTVSPDGRKLAFVARGEIWAAPKDGGTAQRVSRSPDADGDPRWSPDSTRLVWVAHVDGATQLRVHDFQKRETRDLTPPTGAAALPVWSPDGKRLAYLANRAEIRVLPVEGGPEKTIWRGSHGSGGSLAWSPDGEWVAALLPGTKNFRNAWLLKTDGSAAEQVTWLPNSAARSVSWLPDGSGLLFVTGQRTESARVALVELKPAAPQFTEDRFRELFQKPNSGPAKGASKTELVRDGLRNRLRLLPIGIDAGRIAVSPDGKTLLFTAIVGGQENLYTYSLDRTAAERPVPRQLTSTAGSKSGAHWSADGKSVTYLESGRIQTVDLATRASRQVPVTAELIERFEETKHAVFREAWKRMRDDFYDPNYHGADWNGAIRRTYGEAVAGARTPDEMRRVLNLMMGELNASHLGVGAPGGPPAAAGGRLGIDWEIRDGRVRVAAVLPRGPVALAGGVKAGDAIEAVNGVELTADTNLDQLLERQIGKEVQLRLDGGRQVRVRPVSTAAEKALRYSEWVNERAAFVKQYSNGRLGYAHLIDMSDTSLEQFVLDLDAETQGREGVVIDVRNNNGGFVNAYALDVLTRRFYLGMQPRGLAVTSARSALGQRAIEKPVVLLTNQHSLSDAEDFSEGFRALGLGRVVGEPTAGWIIYTSNDQLVDGSTIRVPQIRITTAKGENMELNPRPVDVAVDRPMGESYRGRDSQLEAAVKTLLDQLGRRQ